MHYQSQHMELLCVPLSATLTIHNPPEVINRDRDKEREAREKEKVPRTMDEFYATKTDAGYNFIVITKKGDKNNKNCIKYISMECLLFTFYIFEMYKETINKL